MSGNSSTLVSRAADRYPPFLTLPLILLVSIPCAYLTPNSSSLPASWSPISHYLGYVYFLSWSLSFYPQMLLNISRKTTVGLSPDFALYNVLGFAAYSTYTFSFYYSDSIRAAYRLDHNNANPLVSFQDVLFAGHAIVLSIVGLAQIVYYDGISFSSHQPLSRVAFVLTVVITGKEHSPRSFVPTCVPRAWRSHILFPSAFVTLYGFFVYIVTPSDTSSAGEYKYMTPIYFMYGLSGIKVFITCIKYVPQFVKNWRRRSTNGWNVWNIILDCSGGVFSLLQLVGDCASTGDWSGLTGDMVKFVLGLVSIVFDAGFLMQHYVWYGDKGEGGEYGASFDDSDTTASDVGGRVSYQKIDSGGFV